MDLKALSVLWGLVGLVLLKLKAYFPRKEKKKRGKSSFTAQTKQLWGLFSESRLGKRGHEAGHKLSCSRVELLLPRSCSCSLPSQPRISSSNISPPPPVYNSQHWGTTLTICPCNFSVSTYPAGNSFVFALRDEFFPIWAKPSQFHMSQNLMSKHLRRIISSNHGTKSLISIHPENCILFTAACSWPLSRLPIQLFLHLQQ